MKGAYEQWKPTWVARIQAMQEQLKEALSQNKTELFKTIKSRTRLDHLSDEEAKKILLAPIKLEDIEIIEGEL
jgi:hypothetical protein